jgi:sialidase-1
MSVEYLGSGIIYENPNPHVLSRHGYFPGLAILPSGELIALFVIAEAFEAADATTWVARSHDLGTTWNLEGPVLARVISPSAPTAQSPDAGDWRRRTSPDSEVARLETPCSDYLKPAVLADGRIVAVGYRFYRHDQDRGISIEETGGFLLGDDIISFSADGGRSWTRHQVIPRSRPELLEISGPCLELRSGNLVATAAPFRMPDGSNPSGQAGFLLRSRDKGKTWTDCEVFFRSPSRNLTPFESRICEMQDGRLVAIAWAYDTAACRHYSNHIVVSHDDGRTWSEPIDTGCRAQSSNLFWLGDDLLLTIHTHREDIPRISVRVVDFAKDRWHPIKEKTIYGAGAQRLAPGPQTMPETFKALRFGQPSLLRVTGDEFLAVHWAIEDGQGKIRTHRLRVRS